MAILGLGLVIEGYLVVRGEITGAILWLVALVIVERTLLPVTQLFRNRQQPAERQTEVGSKVAEALSRDPQNLLVLHNVESPFGKVDHVVIRQNGAVIAIDTQSHSGRVAEAQGRLQLNGRPLEKNVLDRVRRIAMWVKDQFQHHLEVRVFVHACLVFSSAQVAVRKPIRGVEIMTPSFLPRFLARLSADRRVQEIALQAPERIRRLGSTVASSGTKTGNGPD